MNYDYTPLSTRSYTSTDKAFYDENQRKASTEAIRVFACPLTFNATGYSNAMRKEVTWEYS